MESRTVLQPPDSISVTDEEWDGSKMEDRLPNDAGENKYIKAYLYRDSDSDPDTKSAYKFPYRMVDADGNLGPANQKALQTIISVLNGAMGGADISDSDATKVYRVCKDLLQQAGVDDIPDLKRTKRNKKEGYQTRNFPLENTDIEVRKENGSTIIQGHGAVFDQVIELPWGDREVVRKGAFKRTINNGTDVVSLFNHDPNYVIGRRSSGTLELKEDDKGLFYKTEVSRSVNWAADLVESIKRGDIQGNSFGFEPIQVNWNNENESELRELIEVKLMDVGPVTFPAYPGTDVDTLERAKHKTGIDVPALARLLTRTEKGKPLSEADREKIKEINNHISKMLTDSGQRSHSENIDENIDMLRTKHKHLKLKMENI